MKKNHESLLSICDTKNLYLFNIYKYRGKLIGIEEDPNYRQLYEMSLFGTPTDYFDWRRTKTDFGSLLDIQGMPLMKKHPEYARYHDGIAEAERMLLIAKREWGYRIRK